MSDPDLFAGLDTAAEDVMTEIARLRGHIGRERWLVDAGYEVTAGSRKADGASGYYATLERLDLCEPEEFYGDTLPEAVRRAHAWAQVRSAGPEVPRT